MVRNLKTLEDFLNMVNLLQYFIFPSVTTAYVRDDTESRRI